MLYKILLRYEVHKGLKLDNVKLKLKAAFWWWCFLKAEGFVKLEHKFPLNMIYNLT